MKNRNLTSIRFVCLFVMSCVALEAKAGVSIQEKAAKKILDATGIQGGFIVHVGCGDGKLTAALRPGDSYLVHGLDKNAKSIGQAREYIQSLGLYGKVSADQVHCADDSGAFLGLVRKRSLEPGLGTIREFVAAGKTLDRGYLGSWGEVVWQNGGIALFMTS